MQNKEECEFYSKEKCAAADMIACDFEGKDYKKCLRYRLYFIKPQTMQLR